MPTTARPRAARTTRPAELSGPPAIPRLGADHAHHVAFYHDPATEALAHTLLTTGLADPKLWFEAKRDAGLFIARFLRHWTRIHGTQRAQPSVDTYLQTADPRWDDTTTYLQMVVDYPHTVPLLNLGPALAILDADHPGLGHTFYGRFDRAISPYYRLYTFEDALQAHRWLHDRAHFDGLPTPDESEPPPPPPALRTPPIDLAPLARGEQPVSDASYRLLAALYELELIASRANPPPFYQYYDHGCDPPVPAFIANIHAHDRIHALWDAEATAFANGEYEDVAASLTLCFDGADDQDVVDAFHTYGVACEVLSATYRLIDQIRHCDAKEEDPDPPRTESPRACRPRQLRPRR